MNDVNICQSCGMPMKEEADYGKTEDGSPSYEYCAHCFQEGKFTHEAGSVEEFTDYVLKAMAGSEEAPEMDKEEMLVVLKGLGRWK